MTRTTKRTRRAKRRSEELWQRWNDLIADLAKEFESIADPEIPNHDRELAIDWLAERREPYVNDLRNLIDSISGAYNSGASGAVDAHESYRRTRKSQENSHA